MRSSGESKLGRLVSKWTGLSSRSAEADGSSPSDRRCAPRYQCELPVDLHVDLPGQISIVAAVARNISAGGMLLECKSAPATLASCLVAFHVPDWFSFGADADRDVLVPALVRHGDRDHLTLGVSFATPL